jgi:hypothetical protein
MSKSGRSNKEDGWSKDIKLAGGSAMAKKLSRRQILGLGAATIAGVGVLGKAGHASNHGGGSTQYQPAAGQQKSQGGRPYWEKSYSGGPIDVKPLAPVSPGKGYKPVVIPNGGALPFKIVDGVKVFTGC